VLETDNFKIAQHANQFGHDTDFNSAIIDRTQSQGGKRAFVSTRDIYVYKASNVICCVACHTTAAVHVRRLFHFGSAARTEL